MSNAPGGGPYEFRAREPVQYPLPPAPPEPARRLPSWAKVLLAIFAVALVLVVIAAVAIGLAIGDRREDAATNRLQYQEQMQGFVEEFDGDEAWCDSGGAFFEVLWAACMGTRAGTTDEAVADIQEMLAAAGYVDIDVDTDSSGDFGGGRVILIYADHPTEEPVYASVSDQYLREFDDYEDEIARVSAPAGGVVTEFYIESE